MKDIYTKEEINIPSSEHIWLNALGGKLESKDLIDKTTNDLLGKTIDSELVKFFDFFRTMLNHQKGDGKFPPVFRKATDVNTGKRYILHPGGTPQLADPTVEITRDGEFTNVNIIAKNHDTLRHILTGLHRKYGLSPHIDEIIHSAKIEKVQPEVKMNVAFGDAQQRCIAKMACNLFALDSRSTFMNPEFDAIRTYILNGLDDLSFKFVRPLITPMDLINQFTGFSHIDHLVGYHWMDGRVYGVVCIYGYFQHLVVMGTSDKDIGTGSLRVDPFSLSSRRNEDLQLVQTVVRSTSGESLDELRVAIGTSLENILSFLSRKTHDAQISHLVHEVLHQAQHNFQEFTPESIQWISTEIGERYVGMLYRNGMLSTLQFNHNDG